MLSLTGSHCNVKFIALSIDVMTFESELQLQLSEAQVFADEEPALAAASPLRDFTMKDTIQDRDGDSVKVSRQLVETMVETAVVQSQMDEEALLEDEVEIDTLNNSPVKRMGRLRRLEAPADTMEEDQGGLTDSKPQQEPKPAINKRLVVKATELPEDLLEMEAAQEEGEEGEEEE